MTDTQILERWGPVVADFESRSKPGIRHRVRFKERYSCTCPGWKFRKDCRHTKHCTDNNLTPGNAVQLTPTWEDPLVFTIKAALIAEGIAMSQKWRSFCEGLAAKIRADVGMARPKPKVVEGVQAPIRMIVLED